MTGASNMTTPHLTEALIVTPETLVQPVLGKIAIKDDTFLTSAMRNVPSPTIGSTYTTVAFCGERTMALPKVRLATEQVVVRDVTVLGDAVRPFVGEGWGRDALMVEEIFRIMENMEPLWVTLNVLEAAALQFPTVDRGTLRHTIMTILMAQRRCVVRLTRAGLRLGPRTDLEGNAFVELDLDYADRYSNSH